MERQRDFFDTLEDSSVERCESPEHVRLREWASQYLDLSKLREPQIDIRQALRYDSDKLPDELKVMMNMLEVLLTPAPQEQIKSPESLARLFGLKIGFKQQEELWVVSVNTKNCIQGIDMVYRGTVDTAMVRIMEVLAKPIHHNSPAMFWLHSHPSGFVDPSTEDLLLHQKICEAAKIFDCDCLDGMVIGAGAYYSMREKQKRPLTL